MCEYKDEQISVQEVDIMKAAVKLLEDDMTFAKGMRGYIAELRKQQESSPAQSQKEARAALRRTGVTTSKGVTKKKIVSWE